jgi:aminopeptidase YwaD
VTRYLSTLFLVAVLAAGCALNPAPAPRGRDDPAPASSRRATAPSPITEASVRAHLEFLAGDALNGRGSGTRDEWLAAAYVASHMRRIGLEPLGDAGGYVQTITMEHREAASAPTLSYPGGRVEHGQEMVVLSLGGGRASGPLQKLQENETVKPGAVVLLRPGMRTSGAAGSQAAALVLVPETPQVRGAWAMLSGRTPATRATFTGAADSSPARPTTIVVASDVYDAIAALPPDTTISFDAELTAPRQTRTWNAVGRLPGANANAAAEVILLSAHLDHLGARTADGATNGGDRIYNGADDDASGTVAVLELAAALAAGPPPARTIVFALFGSEESGGAGSRFFAEHPPAPLPRIVANLQFEMIGRPDRAVPAHTLWLTGYERSTLGPELARQGARLVQDPHPEQNFFERSDNIQFARRGIVAHTVSSYGLHKEYHQPSDEVRLIDLAHMTEAIQSMVAPIQWLADSTFRPEWLPGKKPESR